MVTTRGSRRVSALAICPGRAANANDIIIITGRTHSLSGIVCIVSHSDPQSFTTSLDFPGTSELVEMSPTLLEAQTSALLSLLNLNEQQPSTSSNAGTRPQTPSNNNNNDHAGGASNDLLAFEKGKNGPLVWKVLILDDQSKDVLATSLRVQDLREQGVTLHM